MAISSDRKEASALGVLDGRGALSMLGVPAGARAAHVVTLGLVAVHQCLVGFAQDGPDRVCHPVGVVTVDREPKKDCSRFHDTLQPTGLLLSVGRFTPRGGSSRFTNHDVRTFHAW
jgi:hypothetical protein